MLTDVEGVYEDWANRAGLIRRASPDALRRLPHDDIWLPPEIRRLIEHGDLARPAVRLVASPAKASHAADVEEGDR